MKGLTLKIEMENAAVGTYDAAALLSRAAEDIEAQPDDAEVTGLIRDLNGNLVGEWTLGEM